MSAIRGGLLALATIVLMAEPAAANQPPGLQLIAAEVLMLPLMIVLSVAGGAYAILHALRPTRRVRAIVTAAAAVLAILASGTNGGIAVVIAVIFAALALQRGVQMTWWGLRAWSAGPKPAHLMRANPRRLLPAGITLVMLTTFLLGMAISFAAYWPLGEGLRQKAFRDYVAYQIAVGRQEQARTGQVRYPDGQAKELPLTTCPIRMPSGARVEYAPDRSSFTLLMPPKTSFPVFPYNYLTAQASYRADGSGNIRMIEVHDRDTVCPPDAPVIARVGEAEISKMQRMLEGVGDCP